MLLMILVAPLAFVSGMAFVAWRSWRWFGALALVFPLGGVLALACVLLMGSAAEASAPLQGMTFTLWGYAEVLLLGLLLAAAVMAALARGLRRLLARRPAGAMAAGADRRWR